MLNRNYTVSGDRTIVAIGYNYTSWEVLYLISTNDTRSTKSGILYLPKYTDPFANVFINPVACTLVVYNSFGSVNDFDSHNNFRSSDLAPENYRVTGRGFLKLCTTVPMRITITNI